MAKRRNRIAKSEDTPTHPLGRRRPRRTSPSPAPRSRSSSRDADPPAAAASDDAEIETADLRPADDSLRCSFGIPVGPDGKAPGWDGPDHCASCHEQALADTEAARIQAVAEMQPEDLGPAEVVHLATCPTCHGRVTFTQSTSGASFRIRTLVGYDVEQTFGIGPHGLPICTRCHPNGHVEMLLADEELVPASDAITDVAAQVNGNGSEPQQVALFQTYKPFNLQGALDAIAEKNRDVRHAHDAYEAAKEEAGTLRKTWEREAKGLQDLIDDLERKAKDRARQIAEQQDRAIDARVDTQDDESAEAEVKAGPAEVAQPEATDAAGATL